MSLVNDVLRQLDSDTSKPFPNMPLQSAAQAKSVVNWPRLGFIVLVVALLVILLLQLVFKESIVEIVSGNKSERTAPPELLATFEPEQPIAVEQLLGIKPEPLIPTSAVVASASVQIADVIAAEPASKLESPKVERPKLEAPKLERPKLERPKLEALSAETQPVNIKAVENPGFKQYQLALQAYKKKQYSSASAWIDLAIAADIKDEYLRLKARILMQQGKGEELREFVISQNNNSLAWFQLVAPGLQMFAHYELSNQYYTELTKQQPQQVKWQLAMALNYAKLGYTEETQMIYRNLLNSSLPTNNQKKWIATRLQRMERAGSNRNES